MQDTPTHSYENLLSTCCHAITVQISTVITGLPRYNHNSPQLLPGGCAMCTNFHLLPSALPPTSVDWVGVPHAPTLTHSTVTPPLILPRHHDKPPSRGKYSKTQISVPYQLGFSWVLPQGYNLKDSSSRILPQHRKAPWVERKSNTSNSYYPAWFVRRNTLYLDRFMDRNALHRNNIVGNCQKF